MTVKFNVTPSDSLAFALEETKTLLSKFTNAVFSSEGERTVSLQINTAMKAHCYAISGDGVTLTISGGSESAVLCGVYEAFTDAGVFFEPNGCSAPSGFDCDIFFSLCKDVHPKFRYRGIRQHINFPMDISSYSLKDAKEYIRNIARMRYNAITFHSYGGQWHVVNLDDTSAYSGNFFYGQRHPIPKDHDCAKFINNRKFYCIPEIESEYENPPMRQELAEHWLRGVMEEAKKAYMFISFSVEPVLEDKNELFRMLRNVLELYPDIDVLEIISPECGGSLKIEDITKENLVEYTVGMFGKEILNADGTLDGYEEFDEYPLSYSGAILSLKRALDMYAMKDELMKGLSKNVELRAGLYITDTRVNKILLPIMRKLLPSDVTMSFLPSHGALAVSGSVREIAPTAADWQNTMWYSWAEFDGNMYIQQLATDGMEDFISQAEGEDVYGASVNHWRTAENMLALVYDSIAMITPLTTKEFYRGFAKKLGIENEDLFVSVSDKLAKLDSFCRDNLFNIGFCYVGCWYRRTKGITRPRKYAQKPLLEAAEQFSALAEDYKTLLSSAKVGAATDYLRLMINRCTTTILHLYSMAELASIKDIMLEYTDYLIENETLPEIPAENYALLKKAYENTLFYADKYLDTYVQMLPDRGAEGNIISYVHTVPVYTKELFKPFIASIESIGIVEEFDAPPLPDSVSL